MPGRTATTTVKTPWDPFADSACKIAMTYFDLATPSLGLGSCWNGYFNRAILAWDPLRKALGLSDQMTNYGPSHFIQPHQKAGILHFPLYSL
jgi:nitroreductase